MRYLIIFSLLFVSFFSLNAQKTAHFEDFENNYEKGIWLYEQKLFDLSIQAFDDYLQQDKQLLQSENPLYVESAHYYKAVAALNAGKENGVILMEKYIAQYNGSSKSEKAQFQLGKYYFDDKKYDKAISALRKVSPSSLSKEEKYEHKYKLGYSYFVKKKFNQAGGLFKALSNEKDQKYYYPSNYYYGLVQYFDKKYDIALKYFEIASKATAYKKVLPYYITQIYYLQGKHDKVIQYGEESLANGSVKNAREIEQLIGQAYFKQKNYIKALPLLESNASGKSAKSIVYQIGECHYQLGNYEKAAKQYKQLSVAKDSLGQNALYKLGICNVKMNDKAAAYTAFSEASVMKKDEKVIEESKFNAAKLAFELGRNDDAVNKMQNYLQEYPNSSHRLEAQNVLAELFLNTSNYKSAYDMMKSMSNLPPNLKPALQKVTFFRAVEFYNKREYNSAESLFRESTNIGIEQEYTRDAYFWLGEISYKKKKYSSAITNYDKYLTSAGNVSSSENPNPVQALYNSGYAYLKQEKYGSAARSFEKSIQKINGNSNKLLINKIKPDALLRIGDCYFVENNYSKASKAYREVLDNNLSGNDYAQFQQGMIDGLQGNYQQKINTLNDLVQKQPKSLFADDAIYQKGRTYFALGNFDKAISAQKDLVKKYPQSNLVKEGLLQLGLLYYNKDDNKKALEYYKKVVTKYPKSKASGEALIGIKEIYVEEGRPNEYFDFVKSVPGAEVTISEQDEITYEAAELQFRNGNYSEAIKDFDYYLNNYSNGQFTLNAHFYKGECLFINKDYTTAYKDYQFVINTSSNRFTEKALLKAASISYYNLKDYDKAQSYYNDLLPIATLEENKYEAEKGLMRTNYELKNWSKAKQFATAIQQNIKMTEAVEVESNYYLGRIAYQQNNTIEALELFKKIDKVATEQGAEAKYMTALITYEGGDLEPAKDLCFELANQFGSFEYWVVKGFILLSDVFTDQQDYFQAKATLNSVIQNHTGEELLTLAKKKLQIVEEKERQNSNIEIDNPNDDLKMDNDNSTNE